MSRVVYCQVLKHEAEGLASPPHPGELGQRIFTSISRAGWESWLERLATIMNENHLSTADPQTIELIEAHMRGFLFGEGELGGLPDGFSPQGKGKK